LRFQHSDAHLGDAAAVAKLTVVSLAAAATRREDRREANGRIVMLEKRQPTKPR
jgi:hypothetical protein